MQIGKFWLAEFFFHSSMEKIFHFQVRCYEQNYSKSRHFTKNQNMDGRHYYKYHCETSYFANLSKQSTSWKH